MLRNAARGQLYSEYIAVPQAKCYNRGMRNSHLRSRPLAFSGLSAALALCLLLAGNLFPPLVFLMPALAALALLPAIEEYGSRAGLASYFVVSILSLLFLPDKEPAFLFVFFGWYPAMRGKFSRLHPAIFRWTVKLLSLNLCAVLAWLLLVKVFSLGDLAQDYADFTAGMAAVMAVLRNLFFFVYDLLLRRFSAYWHRRRQEFHHTPKEG